MFNLVLFGNEFDQEFQITFKGRVPTRSFEGSILVSPRLLKLTVYFVESGDQLSRAFDLRPLSYLV